MISRRALRKSLGSRTSRRAGTKSKVIKGSSGSHKPPKFRYPRTQRERPNSRLRKLLQLQTQE